MRTPTPDQLLAVWDRGADRPAAERALLLLAVAVEDSDAGDLTRLPLGQRDALLLELHERLFGSEIVGVGSCPRCEATVEATFRVSDLFRNADTAHLGAEPRFEGTVLEDGVRVRFRLPNSADLLELDACNDVDTARARLLALCVLQAEREGQPLSADRLPPRAASTVAEAMAAADPNADLNLAFTCPDCSHAWETVFDIARFLWEELQGWAPRVLREVDALARAYHWREADILALSPRRRQAYLELCAS